MREVVDQRSFITGARWDCLIVLDSCRFDVFRGVWECFSRSVDGCWHLYRGVSPSSWTLEWLVKVFGGWRRRGTVFVSSTPYVGRGVVVEMYGLRWVPERHFEVIVDLWRRFWDEESMTVKPSIVYRVARLVSRLYPPGGRRLIVWFMQPHYPYLPLVEEFGGMLSRLSRRAGRRLVLEFFDQVMRRLLLCSREVVGELGRYYAGGLEAVMEYVVRLINELPCRTVVVTSDHGELLGESLVRLVLSSLRNLAASLAREGLEEFLHVTLGHRLRMLFRFRGGGRLPASYFRGLRVYFHPPIFFSDELLHVPLLVVRRCPSGGSC